MAHDDGDSSPDSRRVAARRGDDTDDTIQWRRMEARKLRALLECIEFSGINLLDVEDKTRFTDRLAQAKRLDERRRRSTENRPKRVLGVAATVATGIFTFSLPTLWEWLKGHLP